MGVAGGTLPRQTQEGAPWAARRRKGAPCLATRRKGHPGLPGPGRDVTGQDGTGQDRTARAERQHTKKEGGSNESPSRKTAATYSPNWYVSTIGVDGLNFSVRNGKRWVPGAIATAI